MDTKIAITKLAAVCPFRGARLFRLLWQSEVKSGLHGGSEQPCQCVQGRPVLLPGDMLYLRSDAHPDVEFGTRLLAADGTTCLLVPPSTFWQRLEASGRVG
jgi:hypothetical protein